MLAHLASRKKKDAIRRLMKDAAHMPYRTWEDFERRGYTVEEIPGFDEEPEHD